MSICVLKSGEWWSNNKNYGGVVNLKQLNKRSLKHERHHKKVSTENNHKMSDEERQNKNLKTMYIGNSRTLFIYRLD